MQRRATLTAAMPKGARKYRLREYRKRSVEPAVHARTMEELERERRDPRNATYVALHPGYGPAAGVLEGHGWGLHTLGDCKRWACLRLLMRCPAGCPART